MSQTQTMLCRRASDVVYAAACHSTDDFLVAELTGYYIFVVHQALIISVAYRL